MSFSPRPDEIEEVHTHVFTGFADAQQDKIVADAFLRSDPPDDVSKGCEGLDGMLGIVIVPRYSVEPQERKELIAILLQPLFELFLPPRSARARARSAGRNRSTAERCRRKKAAFESESINGFHHGLHQNRESQSKPPQFFVVRVLQRVIV